VDHCVLDINSVSSSSTLVTRKIPGVPKTITTSQLSACNRSSTQTIHISTLQRRNGDRGATLRHRMWLVVCHIAANVRPKCMMTFTHATFCKPSKASTICSKSRLTRKAVRPSGSTQRVQTTSSAEVQLRYCWLDRHFPSLSSIEEYRSPPGAFRLRL
jgi:hypothetical protein